MGNLRVLNERLAVAERRLSNEELVAELADASMLHQLSIELIQENNTDGLYKKIVEAAVSIMRSQYGTMQMFYPDNGNQAGKLKMLATYNFSPEAEKYWEWIYSHTGSSCSEVLLRRERAIVADYPTADFLRGKATLKVFNDAMMAQVSDFL